MREFFIPVLVPDSVSLIIPLLISILITLIFCLKTSVFKETSLVIAERLVGRFLVHGSLIIPSHLFPLFFSKFLIGILI